MNCVPSGSLAAACWAVRALTDPDIPTNGGKTSAYVPSVKQFYVIHSKTSIDSAGLLVYHVNQ